MKYYLSILFCSLSFFTQAQSYALPNEEVVFSFILSSGALHELAADTAGDYLIFRGGDLETPSMVYPENLENSWEAFTYSYYLRGGGAENEGLDLNYIQFPWKGGICVLYDNYSAVDDQNYVGIKLINPGTGTTKDLSSLQSVVVGNLMWFRNNEKIKTSDETFD